MKDFEKVCINFGLDYKFVKFLFVGALNTGFAYGIYSICLFLGAHYALAAIVSTVLGVLFNFKTTGTIVFKNNDNSLIFRFIGVYCITCSLNILLLKIFALFRFNMYFAGAILILPIALLSYCLMKKAVFTESES